MSRRDYYEILGVSRDASADALKSAHRRLARQWHPDVNKSAQAQKRFAEVQEAYDILSDPKKRQAYDRFGRVGVGSAGGVRAGRAARGGWSPVGGGFDPAGGGFGADIDVGGIFEQMFGRSGARGRPGASASTGGSRRGADRTHTLEVTFRTAIKGGKEPLRFGDPASGQAETIEVTIPRGVRDGTRLRIRGRGHAGPFGGPPGDLILKIRVGPHPYYTRNNLDVSMEVPINVAEAALGATVTVPTLRGRVDLKIPPGTHSGQKLRVAGHGIQDAKGNRGDFFATIAIHAPGQLSPDDVAAFERLGASLPDPRTGEPWDD